MVLADKINCYERTGHPGHPCVSCRIVLARLNGDLVQFDLRRE